MFAPLASSATGTLPSTASLRRLAALAFLVGLSSLAAAQSSTIHSVDGQSFLTYRPDATRGIVIESVGDALDPTAFFFEEADLWQLEFLAPSCAVVGPSQLDPGYDLDLFFVDGELNVRWEDATSSLVPGVEIELQIKVGFDPATSDIHMTIEHMVLAPSAALYRVRFPRLELIAEGPPEHTVMAAPFGHGVLLPDPIHNVTIEGASRLNAFLPPCSALTFVEPGFVSMQWWAFYDSEHPEDALLFFGTKDEDGFRKEWLFDPLPNPAPTGMLRMTLRHVPEDNLSPNSSYESEYPFVLRVLRGDWFDAAKHYRRWALQQDFTDEGPIETNDAFSSIVRDTKMFGVTQPPSSGANDPATPCPVDANRSQFAFWPAESADQRAVFGVDRITPMVYYWDFNSFTRYVGDWFPINPVFLTAAAQVAAQGDAFAPYFSNVAYATTLPSFASSYVPDPSTGGLYGSLEPFGVLRETGARAVSNRTLCPPAPQVVPFLQLCQATAFTRDYSVFVAETLADQASADGIYLDVVSGTDVELCYDPAHGHPIGGGSYYTEGIAQVFQAVRQALRVDHEPAIGEFFLQSEGPSERYLPWIEIVFPHLTWQRTQTFCDITVFPAVCPRNGTDFLLAPLYETVYHEFQVTSAVFQLNAPRTQLSVLGIPVLADPFFTLGLRNQVASHVFLGYAPFAASILSPNLTSQNVAFPFFPDYAKLIAMVRNFMDVLELEEVREFTVFGSRLRDPMLTKTTELGQPLTKIPFDVVPINHNWLAYGRLQPFVYGSVHSRGSLDEGSVGVDELGVLLLNWTDPADDAIFGTTDAGDASVLVTVPLDAAEPGAVEFSAWLVGPAGETLLTQGPIAGDAIAFVADVPARSAVFVRVELE